MQWLGRPAADATWEMVTDFKQLTPRFPARPLFHSEEEVLWKPLWAVFTSAGGAHSSNRPRKISLLDSLVSLDSVVWRFGRFV